MKPVALFCSLLLLKLTLADPCNDKTYNFIFTSACDVSEELQVGFTVKNFTQPRACPSTDTVCVSFLLTTRVEFSGTFPDTLTLIEIAGEGKTVKLPIVYAPKILAKGELAQFPVSGTLLYDQKQTFKFPAKASAEATANGGVQSNFIKDKTGDCDVGKLCCTLNTSIAESITIWGTIGHFKSIIITNSSLNLNDDIPVEIPLIRMTENYASSQPRALQLKPAAQMPATHITVPFVVSTVTNAATNTQLKEKPACEEANEPCYQMYGFTSAAFKGKLPANPATITISSDTQTNSYIFCSAGITLKSGLLAYMIALLVARI